MKLLKITLDPTLDAKRYARDSVLEFQILYCEVKASKAQADEIYFQLGSVSLSCEELPMCPNNASVAVDLENKTALFFADFDEEEGYIDIPCLVEWVDDFPAFPPIRNSPNPRQR